MEIQQIYLRDSKAAFENALAKGHDVKIHICICILNMGQANLTTYLKTF